MGQYLILERLSKTSAEGDPAWIERGHVDATSGAGAVRSYITQHGSEVGGGVFMAIPERSSATVRVSVENVRKVSVKAGDDGA